MNKSIDIQNKYPIPVFIFSLPRSGSTLLQRILASHDEIETANEPHLLIYFLNSLNSDGILSIYDYRITSLAINDFAMSLPNKYDDYLSEIRELVIRLYAKASTNQSKYFLDKTPKYAFVVDEIISLFNHAKFIFLWRNPLSIISSINETWRDGNWYIYHYKIDLYQGLGNLLSAYQKYNNISLSLRYEDLILDSTDTVKSLFAYLELPFEQNTIDNFSKIKLTGRVRDPYSDFEEYQVIRQKPLNKWRLILTNPIRKIFCLRYLNWIGHEQLSIMGYDKDQLVNELHDTPINFHYFIQDLYRMPYGMIYNTFELRLLKQKYQSLISGNKLYSHR